MGSLNRSLVNWLARARALSTRLEWDQSSQRWSRSTDIARLLSELTKPLWQRLRPIRPSLYKIELRQPITAAKRPLIVHALPNVFVGGSTQLVVDLCNHLGHDYEMQVITAALPPQGRHAGLVTHLHPLPGDAAAMAATLRKLKPNLLHVHYWGDTDEPWYRALFTAAEETGCRVLQNINTPVRPFVSPTVVANIYVSDVVRRLATPSTPKFVIHPGIDVHRFRPAAFEAGAADSIGMVYRLERDKLRPDSITPLIEIVRRRPRTRAIVVGGGSFFDGYVAQTREAGVYPNFMFTGYVPYEALPTWYTRFRIFIAPVWQESFGQVVPFAMSMGLAVTGMNVGALPEILEDSALLGSNVSELADKTIDLLAHPERLDAVGARNKEIAARRFGIEQMIASYRTQYRDMLTAQHFASGVT